MFCLGQTDIIYKLEVSMCRDIIPAGKNLAETNRNLDKITDYILALQSETGIIPLWATCNLFSHPRCIVLFSSLSLNVS